jgi:hypothetical protein
MPQNYFTRFDDVFTASVYIILIFSQNFFVHMSGFPNLEDNSPGTAWLNDEEPKL